MDTPLRPWRPEYQLLSSIDSVSGDLKNVSPFAIPKSLPKDDHVAAKIESYFKVIETITDFQESKFLRAKLAGSVSSLWSAEAQMSALDSAKVNSKDIFGYYSLVFTKSRVMVGNALLNSLRLTPEAEKAIRAGKFREEYGDMIVVGYVTGGEAEAVLRVTDFREEQREYIRRQLRMTLQGRDSEDQEDREGRDGEKGTVGTAFKAVRSEENALRDATTTLISRRTGVTKERQLRNPNDFSALVSQLSMAAENAGATLSAVCYKIEMFNQVPSGQLDFARQLVDQNVRVLQDQFAQAQYVFNSCEAYLSAGSASPLMRPGQGCKDNDRLHRDTVLLKRDASGAMQRFLRFKGYNDVATLSQNDTVRNTGRELMNRFEDLYQRFQVVQVQARLAATVPALPQGTGPSSGAEAASGRPASQSSLPQVAGPSSLPADSPAARCGGYLKGSIREGKEFNVSRIGWCRPVAVVKLGNKAFTSLDVSASRGVFRWGFEFEFEVTPGMRQENSDLVIEVYEKRIGRENRLIGSVAVPLRRAFAARSPTPAAGELPGRSLELLGAAEAQLSAMQNVEWYQLEKPGCTKFKSRGKLQVAFSFTADPSVVDEAPPAVPTLEAKSRPVSQGGAAAAAIAEPLLPARPGMSPLLEGLERSARSEVPAARAAAGPPGAPSCASVTFGAPPVAVTARAATASALAEPAALGRLSTGGSSCIDSPASGLIGAYKPAVDASPRAAAGAERAHEPPPQEAQQQRPRASPSDSGAWREAHGDGGRATVHAVAEAGMVLGLPVVGVPVTGAVGAGAGPRGELPGDAGATAAGIVKGGTGSAAAAVEGKGEGEDEKGKEAKKGMKEEDRAKGKAREEKGSKKGVKGDDKGKAEKEKGKEAKKRRGALRVLLALGLSAAAAGAAGTAAVVVCRRRFGVDLVAQSAALSGACARAVACKAAQWGGGGRRAVHAWAGGVGQWVQARRAKGAARGEVAQGEAAGAVAGIGEEAAGVAAAGM